MEHFQYIYNYRAGPGNGHWAHPPTAEWKVGPGCRTGASYPNPPTGLVTVAGMDRCLVEEVVKLEGLF
jgi:hypothetical protein